MHDLYIFLSIRLELFDKADGLSVSDREERPKIAVEDPPVPDVRGELT